MRAVSVGRNGPPIPVGGDAPTVLAADFGPGEALDIVVHRKRQLVGDQPLLHKPQRNSIGHFVRHNTRSGEGVGTLQHLAAAQ